MSTYDIKYAFHPINENPVVRDFTDCKYIDDVHLMIKHKFGLPDFSGENWNAVKDLFEDVCYSLEEPLKVEIKNFHCMCKDLQEYCDGMFLVFTYIENTFPEVTIEKRT